MSIDMSSLGVPDTREDWLEIRRSMVGASDMAAILGHGYADQSIITIWEEKTLGAITEEEEKRLTIGTMLEPVLRQLFEMETGLQVRYKPFDIRRHPKRPWIGATLDGEVIDDDIVIPVELKNVGVQNRKDWEDDVPTKFLIQVSHQLAVTGAPYAYLFALIGGNEPVVKRIDRHEKLIKGLIAKATEFWGYVERRELPPVDDSEATKSALSRIWVEDEGKSVCLPPEALQWAQLFEAAKEEKKLAEAEETKYGNLLRAAIGDATFGDIPGYGRYSYKTQERKEHIVKASKFRVLRKTKS